ncbi:MAG: HEPN domain-containing protein [Promethearchaeia archaeon]
MGAFYHLVTREASHELNPNNQIFSYAKELDRVYIPARYPNGLPTGTPRETFDEKEAQEAIKAAREVIKFCKGVLADTQD